MPDKLISVYAVDEMLSKLSGMYHVEDIRGMIARMPAASAEETNRRISDYNSHEEERDE